MIPYVFGYYLSWLLFLFICFSTTVALRFKICNISSCSHLSPASYVMELIVPNKFFFLSRSAVLTSNSKRTVTEPYHLNKCDWKDPFCSWKHGCMYLQKQSLLWLWAAWVSLGSLKAHPHQAGMTKLGLVVWRWTSGNP